MSFTTFLFFGFAAAVLVLYWLLPHRARKLLLLAASYFFYMWSMPAMGLVLLASTGISYWAARGIEPKACGDRRRKAILALCCLLHFGLLFVCKYLQWTLDLAHRVFPGLIASTELHLLLPVGISFYTFAITGYLFDVYRGKLPAERSAVDYGLFTAFFPCILAGPIGRAREFLPQLKQPIPFRSERVKAGVLRFLFGLMQKMVLADNIGTVVDRAYGGQSVSPATWIAVILLYSLQIYFDFAGYSHMAIGLAAAFGLRVPENFRAPYFSASVGSFWRRWHISLTSWFREYLYFPLGGSRKGKLRTCVNILVVFALSGLWHGASTHFVLWGLLNGVLLVLERLLASPRKRFEERLRGKASRTLWLLVCGGITYCLISVTWLLFRADSLAQILAVTGRLLSGFRTGFGALQLAELGLDRWLGGVLLAALVLSAAVDLLQRRGKGVSRLTGSVLPCCFAAAALILFVALFGVYGEGFDPKDFIYFRF